VAAGYLLDPTLATDVRELAVDVDTTFGPNYGRSLGHARNPPAGVRKAKVVFAIDLERFWALYADLLSRPVGG
jgi:inosine-uridine nucleoside N-ribohydrolase